ncbi:MAG: thiamine-phosphate kinase [Bacteroidetes bacterium]|nr:thiamine-phosphate kinase [Bacteroidota bacterium]
MFENANNRTELSQLGEFGLINHIAKAVELKNPESVKGIGDDAAVINANGNQVVVTTDMLVEGVHFDLVYCPLKHLGYKSIVVNLSDVYAMNAQPKQVVVAMAVSNRFSLEAIEELYAGILMACKHYGVDLVGGDTTSSQSGLVLSITAIGAAKEENIVYRNGAKENDLICVTGDLGAAYMGLQLLKREKQVFLENPNVQPDFEGNDYLLERQLKPEAQDETIRILSEVGVKPTSMIDISDGLASEIMHICTQSDKGCLIYESKLPIDEKTYEQARAFNLDPTVCAMNGGEDYELLFTISLADYEKIRSRADISIIGHITAASEGYYMLDKSDHRVELKAQGWDAMKPNV